MHGSKTWQVKKDNESALQQADMRMINWMCTVN